MQQGSERAFADMQSAKNVHKIAYDIPDND